MKIMHDVMKIPALYFLCILFVFRAECEGCLNVKNLSHVPNEVECGFRCFNCDPCNEFQFRTDSGCHLYNSSLSNTTHVNKDHLETTNSSAFEFFTNPLALFQLGQGEASSDEFWRVIVATTKVGFLLDASFTVGCDSNGTWSYYQLNVTTIQGKKKYPIAMFNSSKGYMSVDGLYRNIMIEFQRPANSSVYLTGTVSFNASSSCINWIHPNETMSYSPVGFEVDPAFDACTWCTPLSKHPIAPINFTTCPPLIPTESPTFETTNEAGTDTTLIQTTSTLQDITTVPPLPSTFTGTDITALPINTDITLTTIQSTHKDAGVTSPSVTSTNTKSDTTSTHFEISTKTDADTSSVQGTNTEAETITDSIRSTYMDAGATVSYAKSTQFDTETSPPPETTTFINAGRVKSTVLDNTTTTTMKTSEKSTLLYTDTNTTLGISIHSNTDTSTESEISTHTNTDINTISVKSRHIDTDTSTNSEKSIHTDTDRITTSEESTLLNTDTSTTLGTSIHTNTDTSTESDISTHTNTDTNTESEISTHTNTDINTTSVKRRHIDTDTSTTLFESTFTNAEIIFTKAEPYYTSTLSMSSANNTQTSQRPAFVSLGGDSSAGSLNLAAILGGSLGALCALVVMILMSVLIYKRVKGRKIHPRSLEFRDEEDIEIKHTSLFTKRSKTVVRREMTD